MMEVPYSDYNEYLSKYLIDFTFYVVINIMLMNVVFGIIVDGFAELREQGKLRGTFQKYLLPNI